MKTILFPTLKPYSNLPNLLFPAEFAHLYALMDWHANGTVVQRIDGESGETIGIDFAIKPVDIQSGDADIIATDLLTLINQLYTDVYNKDQSPVTESFTIALDEILYNAGYVGKVVDNDKPYLYAHQILTPKY